MIMSIKKNYLSKIISCLLKKTKMFYETNQIRSDRPGIVCQIDFCQFIHRIKHHRERVPSIDIWICGIADTSIFSCTVLYRNC